MITQPPQHPVVLLSLPVNSGLKGPMPWPGPLESDADRSLLYRLISRTISKNAISTFVRDLAEVSINLQPKFLAKFRPSINFPNPH